MMPFFKELRRKKASQKSLEDSASSDSSNATPIRNKSSSTLGSPHRNGVSTPASSILPAQSTPNLASDRSNDDVPALPTRSLPSVSTASRNSCYGAGSGRTSGSRTPKHPATSLAPSVLSISENSWVHQKVLLISGQIGDHSDITIDGTLTVNHHDDFPATTWPVGFAKFKALVHLSPGPNRLRLDFQTAKASSSQLSGCAHSSFFTINYLPLIDSPPLRLVIIIAKDSPMTYDAVPERIAREGNDISLATRKLRTAAYLWQAFTGEQMNRHGLGRRCFRFEEDWQTGTLSRSDHEEGTSRNEAKIHIIRSEKTLDELRDPDIAQQNEHGQNRGRLYDYALNDIRAYFQPMPKQHLYVTALFLDSHWDPALNLITAHAALGGGAGNIRLAIFGSHAIQSYPACLEEVVPAFSDCTRTDSRYLANDCQEAGSNWEAATLGIGAHLHEVGHLFGCPHQENGVMLRDYTRLNRTFICREAYSTRTKSQGLDTFLPSDECGWHRLDVLRFKHHPCFRVPTDLNSNTVGGIAVWPIGNKQVIATAPAGFMLAEIFVEDDELCRKFVEYGNAEGSVATEAPKQILLSDDEYRDYVPNKKVKRLSVKLISTAQEETMIHDILNIFTSKDNLIRLSNGQRAFRSMTIGSMNDTPLKPEDLILETTSAQPKVLLSARIYHGFAFDGIEFFYEDCTSHLFGNRGGSAEEFSFDARRGETILGFHVRAGQWIDAIEILTTLGRRSKVFGNKDGGSLYSMLAPRGYHVAGISGSSRQWVETFALIITR